jgi:malto-oligosyltrehalose trehalohydrolase
VELLLSDPNGATALTAPLQSLPDGWFELETRDAGAASLYRYRIDGTHEVPDPASRCNPQGVHGPSEVIDPLAYAWEDGSWRAPPWHAAVLYELHVGTFNRPGTYAAVAARLAHLKRLGVTAIELMPLAAFPGTRDWGYDGVLPFAPQISYGRPEELKALIVAAHQHGLAVILDVVYNHFGPEGNYLHHYAPQFFDARHQTPWGDAINFDGAGSRTVRDFFIHNARYWLEEYHIDGLRLDAIDAPRAHPTGAMRSGTMMRTTACTCCSPARRTSTTWTTPSGPRGCCAARWPRASPIRASTRVSAAARAVPAARICRRAPSSTFCRTTTRWAIVRAASGSRSCCTSRRRCGPPPP